MGSRDANIRGDSSAALSTTVKKRGVPARDLGTLLRGGQQARCLWLCPTPCRSPPHFTPSSVSCCSTPIEMGALNTGTTWNGGLCSRVCKAPPNLTHSQVAEPQVTSDHFSVPQVGIGNVRAGHLRVTVLGKDAPGLTHWGSAGQLAGSYEGPSFYREGVEALE